MAEEVKVRVGSVSRALDITVATLAFALGGTEIVSGSEPKYHIIRGRQTT